MLVTVGMNTRHVSFSTPELTADMEALVQAIQDTFADNLQPGQQFFLQIKNEEWGGTFIDVQDRQEIADRSIVRVVMKSMTEVG